MFSSPHLSRNGGFGRRGLQGHVWRKDVRRLGRTDCSNVEDVCTDDRDIRRNLRTAS